MYSGIPVRSVERLLPQEMLLQHTAWLNNDLLTFADTFGLANPGLGTLLRIAPDEGNAHRLAPVIQIPMLAFEPAVQSVSAWRALMDGSANMEIDALRALMPSKSIAGFEKDLMYHNQMYLKGVYDILHGALLGATIAGLPPDVAQCLSTVRWTTLRMAAVHAGVPLFRWRYVSDAFADDARERNLGMAPVLHHLMNADPVPMSRLTGKADISGHFSRRQSVLYAQTMILMGARASSLAECFPALTRALLRDMSMDLTGESPKSGQHPSTASWHFSSTTHRLHSTVFVWLYRNALARGANHIEAIIAGYALYVRLVAGQATLRLPLDRCIFLARAMATGTEVQVAPCRRCHTPYLLQQGLVRTEISGRYVCPHCSRERVRH